MMGTLHWALLLALSALVLVVCVGLLPRYRERWWHGVVFATTIIAYMDLAVFTMALSGEVYINWPGMILGDMVGWFVAFSYTHPFSRTSQKHINESG